MWRCHHDLPGNKRRWAVGFLYHLKNSLLSGFSASADDTLGPSANCGACTELVYSIRRAFSARSRALGAIKGAEPEEELQLELLESPARVGAP